MQVFFIKDKNLDIYYNLITPSYVYKLMMVPTHTLKPGRPTRGIQKEWKKMSDTITQMRLAMRLDAYLREYTGKKVSKDHLYREEWDTVWQVADIARTKSTLTPNLVDDVRLALKKL
jgi:hypothetical protein